MSDRNNENMLESCVYSLHHGTLDALEHTQFSQHHAMIFRLHPASSDNAPWAPHFLATRIYGAGTPYDMYVPKLLVPFFYIFFVFFSFRFSFLFRMHVLQMLFTDPFMSGSDVYLSESGWLNKHNSRVTPILS